MIYGLPERLRAFRLQSSLSQREVAKRINVSPSIISGYETGERTPSVENILALAALFKCSTDELLLGKDGTQSGSKLNTDGLSRKQIRLVSELIDALRANNSL